MKRSLSLKQKLIATFLAMGVLPLLVTMLISYNLTSDLIRDQANAQVELLASSKAARINAYFDSEISALTDMANSSVVAAALQQHAEAMGYYADTPLTKDEVEKVENFYSQTFSQKFSEKNPGETFDVRRYMATLDQIALNAQYDFIANNRNPLGEKDKLDMSERSVHYNAPHSLFHTELRKYLQHHKLYDLFLVTPEGRIVYSVFKETDFAANISRGSLANSGIGRAYSQSLGLKEGEVHVEDFARYEPSYEAPASFAAAPIYDNGTFIGSIIVQFPLDRITAIASDREGLGEHGQVLLLGKDGRLRADAFRDSANYNVSESFKKDTKIKIESEALTLGMTGKAGTVSKTSYDGVKVISGYRPIKIGNLEWVVVSELAESELYASLNQLNNSFLAIMAIAISLILIVAWYTSQSIALKLQNIISVLSHSSVQVSAASKEAEASAATLSEAATEQAASLQETMASAEEISAMINQNADSASKAQDTVVNNDKATKEGSGAVVEMVAAIREIKTTNEQILDQMESSNREFGEIVQIISEIGAKTNVINDIVFQTKLLSFNASVEAARAGEHGKGFAVVAEEVGNLAQMSGNAAKEITDMLTASIKRVNSIVATTKSKVEQLVEIGKDKVAVGQSTADRCRLALEKLSENATTLTSMVTEIAHASKEQAQGVKEINSAISQLDQVTQQNSAVAQQSSSQADALLKETLNLDSAVANLIQFVKGSHANLTPQEANAGQPVASHHKTSQHKATSTSQRDKAPIVSIKPSDGRSRGHNQSDTNSVWQENKLAAGSDIVPSHANSAFEDF